MESQESSNTNAPTAFTPIQIAVAALIGSPIAAAAAVAMNCSGFSWLVRGLAVLTTIGMFGALVVATPTINLPVDIVGGVLLTTALLAVNWRWGSTSDLRRSWFEVIALAIACAPIALAVICVG